MSDSSAAHFAAAISALPHIGPKRLQTLLHHYHPEVAWAVLQGRKRANQLVAAMLMENSLGEVLKSCATADHLDQVKDQCALHGIQIALIADEDYPQVLQGDISAPSVLFYVGDLGALATRRVGVIGTRAATAAGKHLASQIAFELTRGNACVVSGLARGIDAWSHHGAIMARENIQNPNEVGRPVAVVACGIDVVYPKENARLWKDVASQGAIISQWAPGTKPDSFRFPLRNGILAALVEVLVVVESKERGGSMITVDEAMKRDITVLAVPGSPRNVAASGTNLLIQQGCMPATTSGDVFDALGLDHTHITGWRPRLTIEQEEIVAKMSGFPFTLGEFIAETKLELMEAALALGRLEALGLIVNHGGWCEVVEANSVVAKRIPLV